MPGPDATSALEHEVRIDASPETVFGYFTDPSKMVQWMGDEATLDPRPGGVSRISFFGVVAVLGEFVEVVPYSRVVFTWGWERNVWQVPPASTVVEVELQPEVGGTLVRLSHRQLPESAIPPHRIGWEHYFERLTLAAVGEDPGPDAWPDGAGRILNPIAETWSEGSKGTTSTTTSTPSVPEGKSNLVEHEVRVAAAPETVFTHFTDPSKMVQWMGDEATLDPRPGGVFRVSFFEGVAALGEFVEVSPYTRVVFTWGWEQDRWDVPPATTVVEVVFEPDREGTLVRLVHGEIPAAATPPIAIGWHHYFERLALVAAGEDPGPDAWPDSAGRMLNPFGGTWSEG